MEFAHKQLLKKMVGQGVDDSKIVKYFVNEGYVEEEIIRGIAAVEQSASAGEALKELQENDSLVIPKACFEFKHMQLLRKMMEEGVDKAKITEFFLKEGYSNEETLASYYYIKAEIKTEKELKAL